MKTYETKYGVIQITATDSEDEAMFKDLCGQDEHYTHGYNAIFLSGGHAATYFGLTDCEALEKAMQGAAYHEALAEFKRVYGPHDI